MKYTPTIEKAIKVACIAHHNLFRKGKNADLPYVSHLFSVASIVSEFTNDDSVVAAALLHDILEDTDYTKDDLEKDFGKRIKDLVMRVTEVFKKDKHLSSWKERKKFYIQNLQEGDRDSSLIAIADKIHNLQSVLDEPEYIYIRDPKEYAWFHDEVFKITEEKLGSDMPLVILHRELLSRAKMAFIQA